MHCLFLIWLWITTSVHDGRAFLYWSNKFSSFYNDACCINSGYAILSCCIVPAIVMLFFCRNCDVPCLPWQLHRRRHYAGGGIWWREAQVLHDAGEEHTNLFIFYVQHVFITYLFLHTNGAREWTLLGFATIQLHYVHPKPVIVLELLVILEGKEEWVIIFKDNLLYL